MQALTKLRYGRDVLKVITRTDSTSYEYAVCASSTIVTNDSKQGLGQPGKECITDSECDAASNPTFHYDGICDSIAKRCHSFEFSSVSSCVNVRLRYDKILNVMTSDTSRGTNTRARCRLSVRDVQQRLVDPVSCSIGGESSTCRCVGASCPANYTPLNFPVGMLAYLEIRYLIQCDMITYADENGDNVYRMLGVDPRDPEPIMAQLSERRKKLADTLGIKFKQSSVSVSPSFDEQITRIEFIGTTSSRWLGRKSGMDLNPHAFLYNKNDILTNIGIEVNYISVQVRSNRASFPDIHTIEKSIVSSMGTEEYGASLAFTVPKPELHAPRKAKSTQPASGFHVFKDWIPGVEDGGTGGRFVTQGDRAAWWRKAMMFESTHTLGPRNGIALATIAPQMGRHITSYIDKVEIFSYAIQCRQLGSGVVEYHGNAIEVPTCPNGRGYGSDFENRKYSVMAEMFLKREFPSNVKRVFVHQQHADSSYANPLTNEYTTSVERKRYLRDWARATCSPGTTMWQVNSNDISTTTHASYTVGAQDCVCGNAENTKRAACIVSFSTMFKPVQLIKDGLVDESGLHSLKISDNSTGLMFTTLSRISSDNREDPQSSCVKILPTSSTSVGGHDCGSLGEKPQLLFYDASRKGRPSCRQGLGYLLTTAKVAQRHAMGLTERAYDSPKNKHKIACHSISNAIVSTSLQPDGGAPTFPTMEDQQCTAKNKNPALDVFLAGAHLVHSTQHLFIRAALLSFDRHAEIWDEDKSQMQAVCPKTTLTCENGHWYATGLGGGKQARLNGAQLDPSLKYALLVHRGKDGNAHAFNNKDGAIATRREYLQALTENDIMMFNGFPHENMLGGTCNIEWGTSQLQQKTLESGTAEYRFMYAARIGEGGFAGLLENYHQALCTSGCDVGIGGRRLLSVANDFGTDMLNVVQTTGGAYVDTSPQSHRGAASTEDATSPVVWIYVIGIVILPLMLLGIIARYMVPGPPGPNEFHHIQYHKVGTKRNTGLIV